jgi:predicted enzyme related to lactoylglutathione lyase
MLGVSDLAAARNFYIGQLELPLLEEHPAMFAFRAGGVRFSVTGGGLRQPDDSEAMPPATILLGTPNIEETVERLQGKGVTFLGEIVEAPGFMKHIAVLDPDNNVLYIGEYLRDPLEPA